MWWFLWIYSISSFAWCAVTWFHIESFTNLRNRLTFGVSNEISSINTFYTSNWIFCELFTINIWLFVWCKCIIFVILRWVDNNNIGLVILWRIGCSVIASALICRTRNRTNSIFRYGISLSTLITFVLWLIPVQTS